MASMIFVQIVLSSLYLEKMAISWDT